MIFARHVLHGMPLDKAIDAPRWLLGRTWGSTQTNLRMESRFDGHLIDRLMSAGHDVEVLPDAYSDTMGHAGAVVIHPNGTLEGAHDPRADGGAAGFSDYCEIRKASPDSRPGCAGAWLRPAPSSPSRSNSTASSGFSFSVGCGQSLPHTMRSGAAAI